MAAGLTARDQTKRDRDSNPSCQGCHPAPARDEPLRAGVPRGSRRQIFCSNLSMERLMRDDRYFLCTRSQTTFIPSANDDAAPVAIVASAMSLTHVEVFVPCSLQYLLDFAPRAAPKRPPAASDHLNNHLTNAVSALSDKPACCSRPCGQSRRARGAETDHA